MLTLSAVNITGIHIDKASMMDSSNGRPIDSRLRGNDTRGKVGRHPKKRRLIAAFFRTEARDAGSQA
ncbi:MAG: hypothetical protein A3G24_15880 [Betaproteobacteria bacterium RIFCSPLOWO2_12_FULL_62_13]|nr:MAG: hypothetical protein A3G24_15880 [Betaproteobacteria bacterium RIFCSPLOWO2_12_FULL_62_13]